jgi:hypothetical protein
MSSVFVNAVITEHILEEEEWVIVGILDWRSVVEDSNIAVNHLIITNEEQGGDIDGSLFANYLFSSWGLFGKALESTRNLTHEFIVVNIACTDNNNVVSEVVSGMEVTNVISREWLKDITVSLDWLTHHVFSVTIEVNILNCCLKEAFIVGLVLISYLLLCNFKLVSIECAIADHISKELDGLSNITSENLKLKRADFTISLWLETSTHVFNFERNIVLWFAGGSTLKHLLEEVSSPWCLKVLIARAGADENSNWCTLVGSSLSTDTDAIWQSGDLY